MRGKALENGGGSLDVRITPACAGKRERHRPGTRPDKDHPRVCGEKQEHVHRAVPGRGSPPRMRGKEQDQRHRRLHPGITPACAGKSYTQMYFATTARDHPRMCGEKLHADVFCNNCEGSPPHVRGKAGACTHGQARHWDHPRVCGEKVFLSVPATSVLGSPPRMRGKAFPIAPTAFATGITPAYAGKSWYRL